MVLYDTDVNGNATCAPPSPVAKEKETPTGVVGWARSFAELSVETSGSKEANTFVGKNVGGMCGCCSLWARVTNSVWRGFICICMLVFLCATYIPMPGSSLVGQLVHWQTGCVTSCNATSALPFANFHTVSSSDLNWPHAERRAVVQALSQQVRTFSTNEMFERQKSQTLFSFCNHFAYIFSSQDEHNSRKQQRNSCGDCSTTSVDRHGVLACAFPLTFAK
jgi:hypothetical protein